MTDEIRERLKAEIAKNYPSKRQFALSLGVSPQYLEAVLNGEKINTPEGFKKMLDALDLELVVRPKGERES